MDWIGRGVGAGGALGEIVNIEEELNYLVSLPNLPRFTT